MVPLPHGELKGDSVVFGFRFYQVTAQREGQELFSAVLNSTFVRQDGDWKLAFHQQSFR
jgi:hypothetical protein